MSTALIITVVLLLLVALLFLLAGSANRRISTSRKAAIYQDFAKIYSNAVSEEPSVRRDSFIKMDNMLAKVLQLYMSNHENCGTNLKLAKKAFSKKLYNNIWEVHKIRNSIVHDDLEVSKKESSKAFEIYKMSLMSLLK